MRTLLTVTLSFAFGLWLGYSITNILSPYLWNWIDRRQHDRNRQRAERLAIRRDMDLHPAEKGEHYR